MATIRTYAFNQHAAQATCALWVGDNNTPQSRAAAALLKRSVDLHVAGDMPSAGSLVEAGDVSPTLIAAFESYSGQIPHNEYDRLARLAPLAGFVQVSGVWCEGAGRSGHVWPAVRHVYWSRARAYFGEQLRRIAAGQTPDWQLPVTSTRDESHLLAAESCAPDSRHNNVVVVQSDDADMRDWLTAALRADGFLAIARRHDDRERIRGAAAAVIDWPELNESDLSVLRRHVASLSPAEVIALVDFPRPETLDWLAEAGVSRLLPRPFEVAELTAELRQLVAARDGESSRVRLSLAG